MQSISRKSLISFGTYAILFAGVVFFLLSPALTDIENNKKNIIEERKQLATNYDEIASLQKIDKDKAGFEQIKNTVMGYLPNSLNSSQFIVEVEGLAKLTEITIDSVTMSATPTSVGGAKVTPKIETEDTENKTATTTKKTKGGTQQNSFLLSTKADFTKSMAFIKQLEKLSRFNSITAITIAPTEDVVNIKLTGNIYYEQ